MLNVDYIRAPNDRRFVNECETCGFTIKPEDGDPVPVRVVIDDSDPVEKLSFFLCGDCREKLARLLAVCASC